MKNQVLYGFHARLSCAEGGCWFYRGMFRHLRRRGFGVTVSRGTAAFASECPRCGERRSHLSWLIHNLEKPEDKKTPDAQAEKLLPFISRQAGNSQHRALFLPSTAKTRRARRNKLDAEESSLGLKAQPPFSELVVITLSLRS